MKEETYRVPGHRERKTLAEEIAKFALCYALSEHADADGGRGRRSRSHSDMDVPRLKTGILNDRVSPGDELEIEALACPYAAIYHPRAYYPAYVLGEMRAALRRGEEAPSASPHYLPVSVLPPLPDGWRITFLFKAEKRAYGKPDFPGNARDVLTREFMRFPLLVPPGCEEPRGRMRLKARIMQLRREPLRRLAGLGERAFETYSARGLTFFLLPEVLEARMEYAPLRGSLFCELRLPVERGFEDVTEAVESALREVVEEVFPECPRGERLDSGCYLPHTGFHVVRFRRKLMALVFDPLIAVLRAPGLLGVYLPCDLLSGLEESSALFRGSVVRLCERMKEMLSLPTVPGVEIAYDNRLPWADERGALRGEPFDGVEEEHPFLVPTLNWLRG